MSMLDGISPRRMAAGGTFQEETILSVLGSTADHKESARVALEAMRETLRSVGKHEDLVKQWDETLATLENPKTTLVDHTTETPNAHYYEDIPTVVGLVPVVRRLFGPVHIRAGAPGHDGGDAGTSRVRGRLHARGDRDPVRSGPHGMGDGNSREIYLCRNMYV